MFPAIDFGALAESSGRAALVFLRPELVRKVTPFYKLKGTKEKLVPISSWTNWATPGAGVVVCRVLYSDGKEYNVDPKIVEKLFELDFSQVSKYGEEWGTLGFDPQQK